VAIPMTRSGPVLGLMRPKAISRPGLEPLKRASPNANTPPSRAANQYPRPSAVGAIPTIAPLSRTVAIDPKDLASPYAMTLPLAVTSQ
jgi:hypothetical protein